MKELKNIFKLANLKYKEDENLLNDVDNIIEWVNTLNEIDLNSKTEKASYEIMELREDKIKSFKNKDKILKNIPERKDGFYIVPKVIDNG